MIVHRRIISKTVWKTAKHEVLSDIIRKEKEAAKAVGKKHEAYGMQPCGCCDNMTVTNPTENENGDYVIEVELSPISLD